MIDASYDLREVGWLEAIWDAFRTLAAGNGRVIGVIDTPPNMSGDLIELALDEAPLRVAMLRYAFSILIISIILSLMVAGLVFLALNRALVRPMQRLTANMVAFGDDPENPEPHHRAGPPARRDRRRRARIACDAERTFRPRCSRRTISPPWASRSAR